MYELYDIELQKEQIKKGEYYGRNEKKKLG